MTTFACCAGWPVNVTVAVCPRAVAVTVAAAGAAGTGGRKDTHGPVVAAREPGPASDQITSFANSTGLAVISTGPEIVCEPVGERVNVGCGSLFEQAARRTEATANIRVRIDFSRVVVFQG